LSDDEYFWEPTPRAWSLRLEPTGRWLLDGGGGGGPAPDPAPVTTIAWRLGHLGGLALGGFANGRFGDGTLRPDTIDFPSTAQEVGGFLEGHYRTWRDSLAGLEDSEWEKRSVIRGDTTPTTTPSIWRFTSQSLFGRSVHFIG
jgi:hypothetical protein